MRKKSSVEGGQWRQKYQGIELLTLTLKLHATWSNDHALILVMEF